MTGSPTGTHPVLPGRPRSGLRAFWKAPDEFLLDAGSAAELLIARLRLALTLIFLLGPLSVLALAFAAGRPAAPDEVAAFLIALAAVLAAVGALLVVQREGRRRWLSMTTSLVDVSLVSFALAGHGLAHDPAEILHSRLGFDLYFLALAATCLRYDARVAVVAGAAAIGQYLLLVIGALAAGADPGPSPWLDAAGRAGLLAAASGLSVFIVLGLERQQRLSSSDPLTGLFNRRFFDDYLAKEADRADRYHTLFAVAMIDVDHFKQFNDTFGHPAGDRALRTLARVVLRAVRRSDIVARYGGEELVVIFRDTGAEAAVERVEDIRRAVEAEAFTVGRVAVPARITVSAGVASWPADGLTADDIVAAADRRLFEAKAAGRNRVVGPDDGAERPRMALV